MPPATDFFKYIAPSQRPVWGYPHEDRVAERAAKEAKRQREAASANPQIKPAMASEGARPKSQIHRPAQPERTPERTVSLVRGRREPDEENLLSLEGEPEVFGVDEKEFPPLPDKQVDSVTTDEEGEIAEDTPVRPHKKPVKGPHDPERQVYEPDWEFVDQIYFPQLRPDRSSFKEFSDNSRLPDDYILYGTLQFHAQLQTSGTYRFAVNEPLHCGCYVVTNRNGRTVAHATVTLHSASPYLEQADSIFCQFNPSNFGVVAEVIDIRTKPASITHFLAMSDRLEHGEYRLIEVLPDRYGGIIQLWICSATSRFGVPQPIKFKKTEGEMERE